MRLTGDCMSITIVNSAWFFKIEYEVGDSGPCGWSVRMVCADGLCAVLWDGAAPRRSDLDESSIWGHTGSQNSSK